MAASNVDTRLYENYGHILIGNGSDSRLFDIAPESWKDINDWLEKANQRL